jgi:hypothetical protein
VSRIDKIKDNEKYMTNGTANKINIPNHSHFVVCCCCCSHSTADVIFKDLRSLTNFSKYLTRYSFFCFFLLPKFCFFLVPKNFCWSPK